MKRADVLKALDDAFADRLNRMFQNLADSFEGTTKAKATAHENFARGIGDGVAALNFAVGVINEHFKDIGEN
jgi:hypothetical protein